MLKQWQTLALAPVLTCARGQVVDLGYAKYQGSVDAASNIINFLGIRYAAAPLAPQPPANVSGLQQATTQPNACFQSAGGSSASNPLRSRAAEAAPSEDCLFLNVHYPNNAAGETIGNLPVIVFIHATAGSYNGEDLIRQSNHGIVVVVIQYRLGLFGFLPGAKVKNDGALNAGLRAGSVVQHIVANNGRTEAQLFRAAITSSAFLPSRYQFDDPIPEASTIPPGPVVDNTFITQRPTLSLLQGQVNGQALFSVTNAFEGNDFVTQNTTSTAAQYAFDLFPRLDCSQAGVVGVLYAGVGTSLLQEDAIYEESILICPTYSLLEAFPGRAYKAERYLYYFPGKSSPSFNNIAFIDAFAQSFRSFAISLDPNIKVDPSTITPQWDAWGGEHTDMLFNKTESGVPVVQPIITSNGLLGRCRCVH
ncbi:Alpha/Beta hydrolase protein [Mycena crocata]|nr:Alpha/Beta hydrolase protein [Mycena crocata]